LNYYQFHIGDYRGATAHLSNDEDLCYRRLLDFYYDKDGEMPSLDLIARRVRFPVEIVQSILREFFTETDWGWSHERADKEIRNFKKQAEGGKKGAESRWGGHRGAIATPSDTHIGLDSPPNGTPIATNNHKPITNISPLPPKGGEDEEEIVVGSSKTEKNDEKASLRGEVIAGERKSAQGGVKLQESPFVQMVDDRFSEFWKEYPESRRKNLFRAQSAFSSVFSTLPSQQDLIRSLQAFKASKEWRQEGGKFIPSPETWLTERRWQDAPAFQGKPVTKPKPEVDEGDAFKWRSENYPESLAVHPTAATFPFRAWPDSIKSEYRNRNKQPVAA